MPWSPVAFRGCDTNERGLSNDASHTGRFPPPEEAKNRSVADARDQRARSGLPGDGARSGDGSCAADDVRVHPGQRGTAARHPRPPRTTQCWRWGVATAAPAVPRSCESCSVISRRGAIRPGPLTDSTDRVRDTQWLRSKRRTACRWTASWVRERGPRSVSQSSSWARGQAIKPAARAWCVRCNAAWRLPAPRRVRSMAVMACSPTQRSGGSNARTACRSPGLPARARSRCWPSPSHPSAGRTRFRKRPRHRRDDRISARGRRARPWPLRLGSVQRVPPAGCPEDRPTGLDREACRG